MKYIATYKCPLCNMILQYGEPQEIPQEALPQLCNKVIFNQLFAGNQALHKVQMQIPHSCSDGNCGMAYFSGFMKAR